MREAHAHNSTPKGGVSCSKDIPIAIWIVVIRSRKLSGLVFHPDNYRDKFCDESPVLRVAAKHYVCF